MDDSLGSRHNAAKPLVAASPRPRVSASLLLIFIDGIGIGTRGEHNPLDGIGSNLLSIFQGEETYLPFDGTVAITDARLGVAGLPQSATGQTSILTGINAAALIGRHLHGYPSPRLREALGEHSVYKRLLQRGCAVTFANAYSPSYFQQHHRFKSATTVAAETAGIPLRTFEDLECGNAVCHDFGNELLVERGYSVKTLTCETAGERLARIAANHDFTLYEHFITDRLGHAQDFERSRRHLQRLDRFIRTVLEAADLSQQTVVITSDHGNIEDLRTKSHTLNPVATLAFGPERQRIAKQVRSLVDITPAIVDAQCPH